MSSGAFQPGDAARLSLFACGGTDGGQLGLASDHPAMQTGMATTHKIISTPIHVPFPPMPTEDDTNPDVDTANPGPHFVTKISVGARYNLAVTKDGNAYSWGLGTSNQLGLSQDIEEQLTPSRIRWKGFKEWKVIDIAAGGQHVLMTAFRLTPQDQ